MIGLIQAQEEEELCNNAFPMCICRLTLAWISRENSTTHAECWLILTALPSLTLGPYLMPTGLSAVRCRLAARVTLRQLPSVSPFVQFLSGLSFLLPVASISRAQAFVWFRAKTDKGIVCLADHLHSVTFSLISYEPTVEQTGFFNHFKAISQWKGKCLTQTSCIPLIDWFCITSYPLWMVW